MGLNIEELWKQITNPVMALYLDDKIIPQYSKGTVMDLNHEYLTVIIEWKIDNKAVNTKISFEQYEKMKKGGIIDNANAYEKPKDPKFKIGDMVKCLSRAGVIKKYEYDAVEEKYIYTIISAEDILSFDYSLRCFKDEESYLELIQRIDEIIEFEDRTYRIVLEETHEEN